MEKSTIQSTAKLISLQEVLESKERKEQELKFYQEKLEELQEKMYWLRRDIDVTNIIIDMIETETVPKLGK